MGRETPHPGDDAGPLPSPAGEDDGLEWFDPALEAHIAAIGEIDRELEAAIEYKLATGEEAVGEILQIVARVVERRRRLDLD